MTDFTHEYQNYGATIRHTLENDHAEVEYADGRKEQFAVDQGQIAQGADSAHLQATHAAKGEQKRVREAEALKAKEARDARRQAPTKPENRPAEQPPVAEAATDEPVKRGKK